MYLYIYIEMWETEKNHRWVVVKTIPKWYVCGIECTTLIYIYTYVVLFIVICKKQKTTINYEYSTGKLRINHQYIFRHTHIHILTSSWLFVLVCMPIYDTYTYIWLCSYHVLSERILVVKQLDKMDLVTWTSFDAVNVLATVIQQI